MNKLCEYKNIFGEPFKGAHSYRIGKFAFVDTFLTLLITYFINKNVSIVNNYYLNFLILFIILVVISVFVHKSFCVNTSLVNIVDKYI